ncbi:MAG: GDP-L-fucose synthase [Candidatus Thorarchaeota archaeon]
MKEDDLIYVAGHTGLVGSSILKFLQSHGYNNILTITHQDLDLTCQADVKSFFKENKPDFVFLAAARVGGILANSTYPAEFIYDNLAITTNVIHESYVSNVKKLLFLGSSCIYPKHADQPITEEALLSGKLEPTNEAYAISKIAGITMCDSYRKQYGSNFISAMPTNLFGPNDNFDLESSHVFAALMRKIHEAKKENMDSVTIWGSGKPKREFLYVDDLADALIFLMNNYSEPNPINVGTGHDLSIHDLAKHLSDAIGYNGNFTFDSSKPDGTPRKLLDVSKIQKLGWQAKTSLDEGIRLTYSWFLENISKE